MLRRERLIHQLSGGTIDGTSYTYDAAGNRTAKTDLPGAATSAFSYDPAYQLTQVMAGGTLNRSRRSLVHTASSPRRVSPHEGAARFAFLKRAGFSSVLGRGSNQNAGAAVYSYAYDRFGNRWHKNGPQTMSLSFSGNNNRVDSYTYDAAGNRITKTDLPASVTSAYSYDPAYQLTQVMQGTTQTEAYTYDPVGNRTYQPGAPYTYNTSNEMLTREGVPYTYDNDGNLLSKTNGSGTTSYAWDFENRMTSVTLPGTGGTITYEYDPFGRRIYKATPNGTTIYVYDGDNISEELNAAGAVQERYTYGPGVDEPLVGQRQPKIVYYDVDGLGSVTSLTDSTGATIATYTYNSFGFLTHSTGSATNWRRYTAREFDSETGLYYNRARYYDPTVGRFLSEDATRFDAGADFYRYVQNDPVNLTDPLGFCPPQHPCAPMGTAPPPTQYQAMAQNIQALGNAFDGVVAPAAAVLNLVNLYSFHRGGTLDAQVQYGGSTAYANYAYGVYLAASGSSLTGALVGADAYASLFSSYPNLKPSDFDSTYQSLPATNVASIIAGYNDEKNGTLCSPTD